VSNASRKLLRRTAGFVIIISFAVQLLVIAVGWQRFDWRLAQDCLHYGEWIECLHATSRPPITVIGGAVGSWLAAGVAMLMGRFLPRSISVVVPAGAGAAYTFEAITFLHGQMEPSAVFVTGIGVIYLLGPLTAAWLFATTARTSKLTLKESGRIAAVFDP
jgi:hypothetical protein